MAKEMASKTNPEIQKQLYQVALKVKSDGWLPVDSLVETFGDTTMTIAGAMLYSDWRIFVRERRNFDGKNVVGYRWADRRFSKAEQKKIPEGFGWFLELAPPLGKRYTDFQYSAVPCVWTNAVLAALPVEGKPDKRVFERANGHVVIPAHCVRAMWRKTMPLIDKPLTLADQHMKHAPVLIDAKLVQQPKLMPVVDEVRKEGRGITEHEYLPAGTQFMLECYHPTSQFTQDELTAALELAGKFVRLSPAKSSGYGDFELVGSK